MKFEIWATTSDEKKKKILRSTFGNFSGAKLQVYPPALTVRIEINSKDLHGSTVLKIISKIIKLKINKRGICKIYNTKHLFSLNENKCFSMSFLLFLLTEILIFVVLF